MAAPPTPARAPREAASRVGPAHERLGPWRLGPAIGSGDGSQVFVAWDDVTGAEAAVKRVALPPHAGGPERARLLARLRREVELAARLDHPDVLRMFGVGLAADAAWLACERVRGGDLSRYVDPARRLPDAVALGVLARIASVLGRAHSIGVVHRDLKTANVLVDLPRDVLKVADFGVAHEARASLTASGAVLGTPACMAPEQLCGEPPTPAVDAWALGVIAHELFAGERPHRAATLGELLRAVVGTPAPSLAARRPDLPAPLAGLVDPLLRREPGARPGDLARWAQQASALAAVVARASRPAPTPGAAASEAE